MSSKQYHKKYNRKYYLKNQDEIKERSRLWRFNNREKYNEYQRLYNEKMRQQRALLVSKKDQQSIVQIGKQNVLKLLFRRLFRRANLD